MFTSNEEFQAASQSIIETGMKFASQQLAYVTESFGFFFSKEGGNRQMDILNTMIDSIGRANALNHGKPTRKTANDGSPQLFLSDVAVRLGLFVQEMSHGAFKANSKGKIEWHREGGKPPYFLIREKAKKVDWAKFEANVKDYLDAQLNPMDYGKASSASTFDMSKKAGSVIGGMIAMLDHLTGEQHDNLKELIKQTANNLNNLEGVRVPAVMRDKVAELK